MPTEAAAAHFQRVRAVLASSLEDEAKLLIIYLLDRQGGNDSAWPTAERMAADMAWSVRKVWRLLSRCGDAEGNFTLRDGKTKVERYKIIHVTPRPGTSSEFQVVDPLSWPRLGLPRGVPHVAYPPLEDTPHVAALSRVTRATCGRGGVPPVVAHKDERLSELPNSSSPQAASLEAQEGETSQTPSSARARRRRRHHRRKHHHNQGPAGKPADPLAERLRAFEAIYADAMKFTYPLVADRDVPAMEELLGRPYRPEEIDAAARAMVASKWYRCNRGGGTVELLRDNFGELLAKAKQHGQIASVRGGGTIPVGTAARTVSLQESIAGTVQGIARRLRRPLTDAESAQLLDMSTRYLARADKLGGAALVQTWAMTWCRFVADGVVVASGDPLKRASAHMDLWLKSQGQA